jgi:hypothetical protein
MSNIHHSQNYSLLEKAQQGNLEALGKLISSAYSTYGITVKYAQLINGNELEVELRSIKGFITQELIEEITRKIEKIKIPKIEIITVRSSKPVIESKETSFSRTSNDNRSDDKYVAMLGAVLFLIGLFMMIVGLAYDNAVYKFGEDPYYNIGKISNKASWIDAGGFLTVSGSVFLSASYKKLR